MYGHTAVHFLFRDKKAPAETAGASSLVNVDNLLTLVGSASSANSVCEVVFTALGALNHTRHFELPYVRSSLITSRAGDFLLRYCHFTTPP